jgi:hypothetical protein
VTVGLPEALQTVTAACDSSRAALAAGGGSIVSPSSVKLFEAGRFEVDSGTVQRVVTAEDGTFGSIAAEGLPVRTRKKALGYLKRPGATWWVNAGRFESPVNGWSATFEQARDAQIGLDGTCAQPLAGAFDEVERDGDAFTFVVPLADPVTVSLDGDGRLTRWADVVYDYAARSVTVPADAIGYRSWQKASQAASLRAELRLLAREVATGVNAGQADLEAIDAAARAALPTDRAVPVRIRKLRAGTLLYARNPYTKTYHAWRVYLKGGEALAKRVAP